MPFKVMCSSCQEVLYEDVELRPLTEIMKMYDGRCPRCGKKSDLNPENLELTPLKLSEAKAT